MYAQVEIAAARGDAKVLSGARIPRSSTPARARWCWCNGARAVFEPRPVKLGMRADGYVEVLEGLSAGENVVVSANFLIDAESNLKAALGASARLPLGASLPTGVLLHRPVRRRPRRPQEARLPPAQAKHPPPATRGTEMLARIIEWSVRNVFLVLLEHLLHRRGRHLRGVQDAARRDSRSLRRAGDHLHRVPGQAPQVVEDQVTYPLTTAMLAVPKSKVVRGFSMFGASFVYVIFEDGTDIYWARSRVLEYLNFASGRLPQRRHAVARARRHRRRLGLPVRRGRRAAQRSPSCAPSRTGSCAISSPRRQGVAEVASVGGFVKQYQVDRRPAQAAGLRHPARQGHARPSAPATTTSAAASSRWRRPSTWCAAAAICAASPTSRTSWSRRRTARRCCSATSPASSSVPDERRGIAELNGEGEVVGGIVITRYGENALDVIHDVKAKIAEIAAGLPAASRSRRSTTARS